MATKSKRGERAWLSTVLNKVSSRSREGSRSAAHWLSGAVASAVRKHSDEDLELAPSEQRRTEDELAESEARFADVFHRAPYPLAIARVSDAFIYDVNEAFAKVTGYKREEVIGRCSREIPWWPSEEAGASVLGKMRDDGYLEEFEMRVLHRSGEEHTALVSASPIIMHGEPCVVWQAIDITERKRAEAHQRALEDRLREKQNLERLGLVAGSIAHDFNNLLVSVLGNADLLLLQVDAGSALEKPVRAIVESAERAAERTRELLDYAGRGGGKLRPIRLDDLLESIAQLAERHLKGPAGLAQRIDCDRPVWVQADEGQLTRMMFNLIKSSVAAREGAGGLVLELLCSGASAELRVRDSGREIDQDACAQMFDPLFSTKLDGHGIGLASVPFIVERHAGSLHVECVSGQGTTISIRLPIVPAPSAAPHAQQTVSRMGISGHVLLVDDEPEVRATAKAMLAQLGFDVVESDCGATALAQVAREPDGYLFVLLDGTMPGLDGAETLEGLRTINPDLPVLLCSGYSRTDFTQLLTSQSHVAFLTKPYRVDELKASIQSLLDEDRAVAPIATATT